MKHIAIAQAAIHAAAGAYFAGAEEDGRSNPHSMKEFVDEHAAPALALYAYCRERGFPQPETLWRKHHKIIGKPIDRDFAAIADSERVFFITLRATAQALEPLHDGKPPSEEDLDQARAKYAGFVIDPDVVIDPESEEEQEEMQDQDRSAADGKEGERKDFQETVDDEIAKATGEGATGEGATAENAGDQGATARKAKK